MITIDIYKDRDNKVSIELDSNGVAQNISALTRATLSIGDLLLDSNVHSNVFDWTTSGASGQLDISAGHVNRLLTGTFKGRLTIYDVTYPNGLVWDECVVNVK